ncbi:MAG TPA: hypothetical protein VMU97_01900 [Candidatus Dormibacteraeota bacterium]|nr:hypothetical protein [Candidatus Dormibacteraeota bacterium]
MNNFMFIGLGGLSGLLVMLLLLVILVFEIAMLVSVIRNQYITGNARALWIVGMLLIHPLVAIVYYFTDYKKS